jgi:hypothetical protein
LAVSIASLASRSRLSSSSRSLFRLPPPQLQLAVFFEPFLFRLQPSQLQLALPLVQVLDVLGGELADWAEKICRYAAILVHAEECGRDSKYLARLAVALDRELGGGVGRGGVGRGGVGRGGVGRGGVGRGGVGRGGVERWLPGTLPDLLGVGGELGGESKLIPKVGSSSMGSGA